MTTDQNDIASRSWPQDASHENGNYRNSCCLCHLEFIGHKRRVVCRSCEEEGQRKWNAMTEDEREAATEKQRAELEAWMKSRKETGGVETVTFKTQVKIVDANNMPIREGSVLMEAEGKDRGVVTRIIREGDKCAPMMSGIGDLIIHICPGVTRVSNRYGKWKHIPHEWQTYAERLVSWLSMDYHHDVESGVSRDVGMAIEGILYLLPEDTIDYYYESHPKSIEEVLEILTKHLTKLSGQ